MEWACAVESIIWPLNCGKMPLPVIDEQGGEIAEARNRAVSIALAACSETRDVSELLWIDDDVIVSRGCLLQLLSHNRDIVSGVYFLKGDLGEPLIFPCRGGGTSPFVPDEVKEVWGHGMGLTLVRTEVYRRMEAELKLPLDRYGNPEWYRTPNEANITVEDGVMYAGGTEDLYFLHNAAKLGYRPLLDGTKHAFGFHYDLRRREAWPQEQWAQYRKGRKVIWNTPTGLVVWE